MHVYLVGIAGGTGTGKSTITFALRNKYPHSIAEVHVDDYYKLASKVPVVHGMTNWDNPVALDWVRLVQDLTALREGRTIQVSSRGMFHHEGDQTPKGVMKEIASKPVVLVEGHLVLHDPVVRALLDYAFYLDLPFDIALARRTKFRNQAYEEKILRPMHEQYVVPTRQYANEVLDRVRFDLEKTVAHIEIVLTQHFTSVLL